MSLNHTALFPADRATAVNAALEKAFGSAVVSESVLLTGGLSAAAVYKIMVDDRPYVMKLAIPGNHTTEVSFERIALAAKAGIAPSLHYINPEEGIIISGFVDSKPVRHIFGGTTLAEKLAEAVKKIHAIPYTVPGDDMKVTIDQIVEGFRQNKMLTGPIPDECLALYEKAKRAYPWQDADKVFSHNDLNPSNILCDGANIWIIDFDTAFLNDRYIDLAGVANFFIYSPEQEAVFLETYFGVVTPYQTARFYVMRQISRIIYSLMMLQLAGQNKAAGHEVDQQMESVFLKDIGPLIGSGKLSLATYEGQLLYGKALMHEAVLQMRSERFDEALLLLENNK
ncbi:phosphotransferase [Chitinophaga sp. Cy-1792]|uniref:phosphotransferase n=1 Tax=Chitinophaga sp. Cy-1792 TaxID=2608339 RepID=UPI00141F4141|nr:phosphotransferase [Chitinophaga sp. Cy-1792]NIG55653.1 phosphotransferase [Chitinophaga sp. Cy-1792]